MRTGIGHQDAVPMTQNKLGVSNHAHAVVAEPVQQDDGLAVAAMRQ
jgi:hypothetical protein